MTGMIYHSGMAVETIPCAPSGNISAVSYDDDSQSLYVSFVRGGHVYRYPDVPRSVALGFSTSLSANTYLKDFVTPNYQGEKMPAESSSDASTESA